MKLSLRLAALFCVGSAALSHAEDRPNYKVLAEDKGHVMVINAKGDVEWDIPCPGQSHDIAALQDGNYLIHISDTVIEEYTPDKRMVWRHESKPIDANRGVQIHAFQRLPGGNTMVAESGNARIIEVDRNDRIVKEIPLVTEHPSTHSDTRLVRKLENDHYLAAQENDATVREYDESGKVVWSYKLDLAGRPATPGHGPEGHGDHVYSAYRLPDGNTLIGCGNGNRVIEVTPEGKIVWSVEQKELPGITLAWVTMLEVLPNGNIIIGNCHAGPSNPQLIEITRDKQVVWTFKDMTHFGNAVAASQVLGIEGRVIR